MTKRDSTGVTPFNLVHGHDAILHVEVRYRSNRVIKQYVMTEDSYAEIMHLETEALEENRLRVFLRLQCCTHLRTPPSLMSFFSNYLD